MTAMDFRKQFGSVEFDGAKYILMQDAYLSGTYGNVYYQASSQPARAAWIETR